MAIPNVVDGDTSGGADGQLVIVDPDALELEILRILVEQALRHTRPAGPAVAVHSFRATEEARAHIAEHRRDVRGVIQEWHLEPDGHSTGIQFLLDNLRSGLPRAKHLICCRAFPDGIDQLEGQYPHKVHFIGKATIKREPLSVAAAVRWLMEDEAELSDDDEARQSVLVSATTIVVPAWREVMRHIAERPSMMYTLDPRVFEELVAEIFRRRGWNVSLTARTRDGGYDIVAVQEDVTGVKLLIEAKRYAEDNAVPVGVVRSLYGLRSLHSVSKVVLATTSHVSPDARREFTRVVPWELDFVEGERIVEWCRRQSGIYVTEETEESKTIVGR